MTTGAINRSLTFLGAGVATFFWGELITSFDVSSPRATFSAYAPLLIACGIGIVFVLVELILKRRDPETLAKTARDIALVSFTGSFGVLFGLLIILLLLGYVELALIFMDVLSAIFLGVVLFVSTFLCIFILRAIRYLIRSK